MSKISGDYLAEGAALRSAGRIDPVLHLIVRDTAQGWLLWCSAGKAVEHQHAGSPRRCSRCRAMAREAVEDGTLSAESAAQWT